MGLHNLTKGNKNPLWDYNKAFQNLQARRRMKPRSANGETAATKAITPVDIANHLPCRQKQASELKVTSINTDIDSDHEEEEAHNGMNILSEPGASLIEDGFTFATMGADDVALDMDTECGYITSDELSDESKDDLDDSIY